jgi:hypothetical protein
VGMQRISGDHHPVKVQAGQQWPQAGDLARGAVDLALGQDRAAGVVHRGQQVDLAAIAFGAPECLAVHRQGTPPPASTVPVGRGLGMLERVDVGELGQGRWDRR